MWLGLDSLQTEIHRASARDTREERYLTHRINSPSHYVPVKFICQLLHLCQPQVCLTNHSLYNTRTEQ